MGPELFEPEESDAPGALQAVARTASRTPRTVTAARPVKCLDMTLTSE
jgi:hypothetical protein